MRILSLAAAALVAAAMPTEALECRQFGGTCKSKSAGCENGSFRRGFCSGSSVCCVGHEGTRSNFNIKTVGTVNDGHGHTVTIKKFASGNSNRIEPTIFFKAKMAVDADGANSAYNPRDSGIDYLANAGCKNNRGSCYGIGKVNGRLAKQDSNSEYPGFYTSSTSLAWSHSSSAMTKSDNFIDSLKVPYVVVPGGKTFRSRYGARVGDLGVIYDPKTNYVVPVYAADSGPATKIGEASIRLMEAIGHKVYDRNNRCNLGINPSRGIVYVLFSGSGSGRPYTLTDLWKNVEEHIENFGGMAAIAKAVDAPSPVLMTLEQFCAAPTFHPKFNTGRNPNYKVPEGRYCSPTYPSPAEGTMNGGTPVTPAEGSAPTADEAPADSPGSEIIDAAEDALETCDNHGDLFCRPGKSSCAHGYHSGECRGDTWCCKPEPQLAACDNHPDLVCRPGKSSCSNGIHFGECRGDTWCCK